MRFEELDHTADLSIRAFGRSLAELFENAAFGMFSLIWDPSEAWALPESISVSVEATDEADLLRRFLSELLFAHEDRGLLLGEFHVRLLKPGHLVARAHGVSLAASACELRTHIKAVTYHNLEVRQLGEGHWVATIVFDT